jgi:ABC-type spermidine/putrescine transport system permease subunit I
MSSSVNLAPSRFYRPPRTIWRVLLPYLLITPPVFLILFCIVVPAVQAIIRTLVGQGEAITGSLSLTRYITFFQDKISVSNLWFTLQITIVSLVVLYIICFPLALYLRFSKSRLSSIVQTIALFPLFVPGIILGYALAQFLSALGPVNQLVKITGLKPLLDVGYHVLGVAGYRIPYLRPEGIVIGLVWESIPFTVLILSAGLGQIDDSLLESARDVGASNRTILLRIILPLVRRSMTVALCLNFIGLFGSYTLPYLLGPAAPQMMSVFMQVTYGQYRGLREAETQAVITFAICVLVGLLYIRTVTRKNAWSR